MKVSKCRRLHVTTNELEKLHNFKHPFELIDLAREKLNLLQGVEESLYKFSMRFFFVVDGVLAKGR
jgi:hypothetical protein